MKAQVSEGKPLTFPKGNLVISIAMETPRESKSGLTLVVASTRGNQASGVTVNEKPLIIGLNAYIRKDGD